MWNSICKSGDITIYRLISRGKNQMAYQLFLIIMNKLLDGEDEIALVQLQVKVWLCHQQVTNTKQMLGRINFPWDNCTFGSFACKSYTDDWGLCKENVELRVIFSFF